MHDAHHDALHAGAGDSPIYSVPVSYTHLDVYKRQVITNVADAASVAEMIDMTLKNYGSIDAIVNNAGINIPRLLVDDNHLYELDEKVWDSIMNVNLKGVFLCAQAAGHIMTKQGRGIIINMSCLVYTSRCV